MPFETWLASGQKAYRSKVSGLATRFVRFSGESLTAGVEEHRIENQTVKVYGAAKTVADWFKFHNKIGLDVALEALRKILRDRRTPHDELWRFAISVPRDKNDAPVP